MKILPAKNLWHARNELCYLGTHKNFIPQKSILTEFAKILPGKNFMLYDICWCVLCAIRIFLQFDKVVAYCQIRHKCVHLVRNVTMVYAATCIAGGKMACGDGMAWRVILNSQMAVVVVSLCVYSLLRCCLCTCTCTRGYQVSNVGYASWGCMGWPCSITTQIGENFTVSC